MENQNQKKPWIKEAIYSLVAWFLLIPISIIVYFLEMSNTTGSEFVKKIDWYFFWNLCSGLHFYDIISYFILAVVLVLSGLSIYWGIRSIRKTTPGSHRGRMLGIVSTTLAMLTFGSIIVSLVVSYPDRERIPEVKYCKYYYDHGGLQPDLKTK